MSFSKSMKYYLLLLTLTGATFCISNTAKGQDTLYLPNVSQLLDKEKYSDVKGSQYLYEEWLPARALLANGSFENVDKLNFNGHSKELEIMVGEQLRQVPAFAYIKVTVEHDGYENIFIRGIHPEFRGDLVCLLYDGNNVKFVLKFVVKLEEIAEPNAITKKFIRRSEYYLIKDGRISEVLLKKKKILAPLVQKGIDLEAYIEENDLNLKTEAEVINLLKYYDSEVEKR